MPPDPDRSTRVIAYLVAAFGGFVIGATFVLILFLTLVLGGEPCPAA